METAFDFPSKIRNWQRAHRWFRSQGRAFSLEGNFRPKRGQEVDWVLDENGRPLWIGQGSANTEQPINFWMAWDVELAWRKCSPRSRWCLKYHYHDAVEPRLACILIRRHAPEVGRSLRVNAWRDYMRIARLELRLLVDLEPGCYYKRAA